MVSRINETLRNANVYPTGVQVGTGTTGTAVVYDYPFSETPVVIVTGTSGSASVAGDVNIIAQSATGHTALAKSPITYNYMVIGLRQ